MKSKKLLCLLMAGILCLLCACGSSQGGASVKRLSVSANISADGDAYIPMDDGSTIKIEAGSADVAKAMLSSDNEHIIVLQEDGTLYFTDKKLSEKNELSDSCAKILGARNDGIIYQNEDGTCYRALFTDTEPLELGSDIEVKQASNNLSLIYAANESIYTLPYNSAENNKIGNMSDETTLCGISNDGRYGLLTVDVSGSREIYLTEDGNISKLDTPEIQSEYTYSWLNSLPAAHMSASADGKLMVITSDDANSLWIKQSDKDIVKANLGTLLASSTIYTKDGYLSECNGENISSIYVAVEGNSGDSIYNITLNGEREQVLSGVSSYSIKDGYIFYTDTDNTLYYAKFDGAATKDEAKIASDVAYFDISDNAQYIYYIRDFTGSYSVGTGALYMYKVGTDEPEKVDSDVYKSFSGAASFSSDGSSIYYLTDASYISDSYTVDGTLMKWTYGSDAPEKIASEVVSGSLTSNLYSGELNSNGFWFEKYDSSDSDGNIHVNLMYCKGTETEKIVSDVIH